MKLSTYARIKQEEAREKALQEAKDNHKCRKCVWGSFSGNKYVCMFNKCIKKS
ncbi:hypothetical protein BJQ91_03828 [Bacillus amyloliquefaciens]|nr:hypothetical protein [Bacillus amyloliquefaciens]